MTQEEVPDLDIAKAYEEITHAEQTATRLEQMLDRLDDKIANLMNSDEMQSLMSSDEFQELHRFAESVKSAGAEAESDSKAEEQPKIEESKE